MPKEELHNLTRRDFLKINTLFFLTPVISSVASRTGIADHFSFSGEKTPALGRITSNNADVFDAPSSYAKKLKTYWKDLIYPITDVTVGDEPAHNRIWYELGGEGYVHSGVVQPVEIQINPPVVDIAETARLAEVTVPFTDAIWDPRIPFVTAYRLYYGTTFWVVASILDDGDHWYIIQDDYYKIQYYVHAEHLRLVERTDLTPLSADVAPEHKRLEVNLEQQVVIAYENEQPVFMSKAATGAIWQSARYETPLGRHYITHKRPSRHMTSGNLASPTGYDLPGVPWVTYITDNGISFHGTYWHNDFGKPRSHGCINLPSPAAKWVYRWSLPTVAFEDDLEWVYAGTRVDVIKG